MKNSQISKGTAEIGLSMDQRISEHPSAVNINGAVSPITREIANKTPVKIPLKAAGNCTRNITLALLPPKANPASLRESGRIFKVSSVERMIRGNLIIHKETLPAIAE